MSSIVMQFSYKNLVEANKIYNFIIRYTYFNFQINKEKRKL